MGLDRLRGALVKRFAAALAIAASSALSAGAQDATQEMDVYPLTSVAWPMELEPEASAFQVQRDPGWSGAAQAAEDAKLLRIFADILERQPSVWSLVAQYQEKRPLAPQFAVALFQSSPSGDVHTIEAVDLSSGRRRQCELPIDNGLWWGMQEVWNGMLERTRAGSDTYSTGIPPVREGAADVYHFGSDEGRAGFSGSLLPGLRPALLAEIATVARDYCMTKVDAHREKLEKLTEKLRVRLEKKLSTDALEGQLADLRSDLNSFARDAEIARGKASSREDLDKIVGDLVRRLHSRARQIDVEREQAD